MTIHPVAYDLKAFEMDTLFVQEPCEGKDDQLLNEMRAIIKDYVSLYFQNKMDKSLRQEYQSSFEAMRSQLRDNMLREYSSFDFMEKIYMQEHAVIDNNERG